MNEELKTAFESRDFEYYGTGGGCTAWRHELENGDEILITGEHGHEVPSSFDEKCLVGLYDEQCEELFIWHAENVEAAFDIAKYRVSEYYLDHEEA